MLVRFQGYPLELLWVTVAVVPSMHMYLSGLGSGAAQSTKPGHSGHAADLISVHYAFPKALSSLHS